VPLPARRSAVLLSAGLLSSVLLSAGLLSGCGSAPPPPAVAPVEAAPAAMARVEPQRDWGDAVLYFVVLDRFADGDRSNNRDVDPAAPGAFHGGDLAGLTAELDEIAALGATAIWITPVVDNIDGFVTGAGFPDWAYHGYWADDFRRLDPRFGSEAELARLVAEAHRRGLKVLLDVVYNHAGYGSRYLADSATRGWLRLEERGECGADDLTLCVAGLPDFRTERPEVAEELLDAHLDLAERSGVDGFRLDTVKHVDHDFWREHRRRARQRLGEGFFLVGEVWGGDAASLDPWFAGDEMDAGFDFSFQGSVVGWLAGRGRTVAFDRYLQARERVRDGYRLAHFLSSHDVTGALHLLGGDVARFRLAAVLQLTAAGLPTIYYGEEVGRRGGEWPANRSDMPWGERAVRPGAGEPRDEALREHYRRLISIRRAQAALREGRHRPLASEGDLLVFARETAAGESVIVAVNRGAAPASARVPLPAAWRQRPPREALEAGARAAPAEGGLALEVPPLAAGIWVAGPERGPG
jgi:alpha-amylase